MGLILYIPFFVRTSLKNISGKISSRKVVVIIPDPANAGEGKEDSGRVPDKTGTLFFAGL